MDDFQKFLDEALKNISIPTDNIQPEKKYSYDINDEARQLMVKYRTKIDMTQKELAKASKVSQANISKFENGTYVPSLTILQRIATGLGKRLVLSLED